MTRSLCLALASLLLSVPMAGAAFKDVPESHVHAEAIAYVQAEGIVDGYADGTYKPDALINRAEFLKIVAGSFDEKALLERCVSTPTVPFKDAERSAWYAPFLCAATQHGLRNPIEGYPDGTFRPAQNISFVEAAKILVVYQETRMLEEREKRGSKDIMNPFSVSVVDALHWFDRFVLALEQHKAIPLSILTFDKSITRGEMAEMIYRLHADIRYKPTQTFEALNAGIPLREKDVQLITKYYDLLPYESTLTEAFALRATTDVSLETFQEWYADVMYAHVYQMQTLAQNEYAFYVLMAEENGTKTLYEVVMLVKNGKLETLSSERVDTAVLDSATIGATSATVNYVEGDIVLNVDHKDSLAFEVARIAPEESQFGMFAELRFVESNGRPYLFYSMSESEGRGDFVYDLTDMTIVHSGFLEEMRGFTVDGKFYYSCTSNGLIVGNLRYYSLPDFLEIAVELDNPVHTCEGYDPATNRFFFSEENDDTPKKRVMDFATETF